MYNKHRNSRYQGADAMKKQAIEHTRLLALSLLAGEDMYG